MFGDILAKENLRELVNRIGIILEENQKIKEEVREVKELVNTLRAEIRNIDKLKPLKKAK